MALHWNEEVLLKALKEQGPIRATRYPAGGVNPRVYGVGPGTVRDLLKRGMIRLTEDGNGKLWVELGE